MDRRHPHIPEPATLWPAVRNWVWAAYAVLVLLAIPDLFVQYWFNTSLGFETIFFTNLEVQLWLFGVFGALCAAGVIVPLRLYAASPGLRRAGVHAGCWAGVFGGWRASHHHLEVLLAMHGVPFGRTDPVFGHDIGFYVYWLPLLRALLTALTWLVALSALATVIGRYDAMRGRGVAAGAGLSERIALLFPPYMRRLLDVQGVVVAVWLFLQRYALLLADNEAAGVRTGAQHVDVTGVFSTLNYLYVSVGVEVGLCVLLSVWLKRLDDRHGWRLGRAAPGPATPAAAPAIGARGLAVAAAGLVALDLACFAGVVVRNHVFVKPNEPWIQLAYIRRHIDATLHAYRLDNVRRVAWNLPGEAAAPEQMLASKTLQNAPILPSWVSRLEEPPDVQHLQRLELSQSLLVYGPMLQVFNQQQALRPYYQFTNVDGVRYTVNGQKKMFVSAVRELPSLAFLGPKEWLRYWGSAALMFTHGYGLVMSPVNETDELGNPRYVSDGIPPRVSDAAFAHEPRIYFGEGAKDDYVLTNVRGLREFDRATEQFREEFELPAGVAAGIRLDSVWKRIMFAVHTGDVTAFLFSGYIDHQQTRIHLRRTPMIRAAAIAPFLFLESNNHAFVADGRVHWMVNALTTTDMYPYAFREVLGDKADDRAVHAFPERVINYAEDAVKITMDAYSGAIRLYQMTDDPIVSSWARVYPDLFTPASQMPDAVKAQLTYPLQWFHVQFDDIFKRYHQRDPVQFYNVEDLWDDADEVLGSIGRGLKGFGSTDQSTFSFEGHPMLVDPADLPAGVGVGTPGALEYVMVFPFTPEGQRNLRSLIVVFQDPEHYGTLVSLQIPQGEFVPGPEQIESYIDNDRPVHQQVTMWIRHASEVVRGHMVVLPLLGDLMYIETIWVSSTQNELPQMKLVAVRYRERITSGATLEEAIRRQGLPRTTVPPLRLAADEPARTPHATRMAAAPEGPRPRRTAGAPAVAAAP